MDHVQSLGTRTTVVSPTPSVQGPQVGDGRGEVCHFVTRRQRRGAVGGGGCEWVQVRVRDGVTNAESLTQMWRSPQHPHRAVEEGFGRFYSFV